MSGRVTSSGNMPAVCSNNVRRNSVSAQPNRCAMPGRYHTGSMAILATAMLPLPCTRSPSALSRPAASALCISCRSSRALVMAMVGRMSTPSAISALKASAARCPQGSSETMRPRLAPLRERPDAHGGMRVGEVRPADRIERACGDRKRAIERIGAAVAADGVAVARPRNGADDRAAFARARRPPADRKARLAAGLGMRGDADMIGPVRAIHLPNPKSHRPAAEGGPDG